MKAVFVELPAFARHRADYLDDDAFEALLDTLMTQPLAGDVIKDTGGLRKLRFADARRGKGTRGGLRVIYYWWVSASKCLLFTVATRMRRTTSRPRNGRNSKSCSKPN